MGNSSSCPVCPDVDKLVAEKMAANKAAADKAAADTAAKAAAADAAAKAAADKAAADKAADATVSKFAGSIGYNNISAKFSAMDIVLLLVLMYLFKKLLKR